MDEPVVNSFKWSTFIEPIIFFIAFSFGLSETVLTDEILLKTCEKELGDNNTDCSSLNSLISLQEIVQPRAATILALKSFIENFVAAIMCIFFGFWCDRIGRKPILLIAATGTVLYYTSLAVLSYFNVDPYWYLGVSFITSLFGGFPTVIMACYIYATDIINHGDKFHRLNFVDLSVVGAKLVGCLVYPVIVKRFAYWVTFTISSVSCFLGLICIGLVLEESLLLNSDTSNGIPQELWETEVVKTLRKLCNCLSASLYVCYTLLVIALHDDNIQGTSTTHYLYAQQFQLSLFDFSIYTAVYYTATAILLLLLVPKYVHGKPCNSVLATIIGLLSNLISAFTRAFAKSSTALYTALGVGAFSWISMHVNRKIVMKSMMPRKDLRKGLTIMTAVERIVLSVMIPLNIYLCSNFITSYPHPVWLMQVVLLLLVVLNICGLSICSFFSSVGEDD